MENRMKELDGALMMRALRDDKREQLLAIRNMARILAQLEHAGENDMGNLKQTQARKFHTVTDKLRALVDELMREVKL